MAAFIFSDPRLVSGSIGVAYSLTAAASKGELVDLAGVAVDPTVDGSDIAGLALTDASSEDAIIYARTNSVLEVTEDIVPGRTYVCVATGQYDLEENLPVGYRYRATLLAISNTRVRLRIYNTDLVKEADTP